MSNALFVNGLEILGSIFCCCFDFFFSFAFELFSGIVERPISLILFGAFTFCHSHRAVATLGGSRRLSNAACTSSNHLDLQPLLCRYLTTDMVLTNFVRKSCSVIWSIFCCVFTKPIFSCLYDKYKKCIKSIGLRVQNHVEDSNLPLDIMHPFNNSKIQPRELIKPDVDISLSEF